MKNSKVQKALELLLNQDNDGFKLALHMGGFSGELSFKAITEWVEKKAEDDHDISIFIEDLESNLSDHPVQNYLVKSRCVITYPVIKTGNPDFCYEDVIPVKEINKHLTRMTLMGSFITVMINNSEKHKLIDFFDNKENVVNSLHELKVFTSPFSDEVNALIDLLCDDTINDEGETTPSLFKQSLNKLSAFDLYYCTTNVRDNGDLSMSCTVKI